MKLDTAGIDKHHLITELSSAYGLDFIALDFLPKGESGYHYIAIRRSGGRLFVKVQDITREPGFERGLEIAAALRDGGIDQALAALRTCEGELSLAYGRYRVAVFPFLDGNSAYEEAPSDAELRRAATLLAAVHESPSLDVAGLPEERLENPFTERILRALRAAETRDPVNAYQRRVSDLVLAEQTDIRAALAVMARLKTDLVTLPLERVPTHGDPNLANFVRDGTSRLYLVDWSEPAFGPAERDLVAFTGDRFDLFLRQYITTRPGVRLHERIFAFYIWRWTVQEIADYTTRILFTNTDPGEDEHAWTELQPYLPVPHAAMETAVEAIDRTLRDVLGG